MENDQKSAVAVTVEAIVRCPFCGEEGFDFVGLKSHLQHGDCEPFENTELASRIFLRTFNAANSDLDGSRLPEIKTNRRET